MPRTNLPDVEILAVVAYTELSRLVPPNVSPRVELFCVERFFLKAHIEE
jgi:hypothetical protein